MREKVIITDPSDPLFIPKTLESFLSQKRTSQTGFFIAARFNSDNNTMTLWFSSKWHTRILEEFEPWVLGAEVSENSWRLRMDAATLAPQWELFLDMCRQLGYTITPVRSFRRFTR